MHPLELFSSGQFSARLHRYDPVLLVNHADRFGVVSGYTYDLRSEKLTLWAGTERPQSSTPDTRLIRYPTFDSVDGERGEARLASELRLAHHEALAIFLYVVTCHLIIPSKAPAQGRSPRRNQCGYRPAVSAT